MSNIIYHKRRSSQRTWIITFFFKFREGERSWYFLCQFLKITRDKEIISKDISQKLAIILSSWHKKFNLNILLLISRKVGSLKEIWKPVSILESAAYRTLTTVRIFVRRQHAVCLYCIYEIEPELLTSSFYWCKLLPLQEE